MSKNTKSPPTPRKSLDIPVTVGLLLKTEARLDHKIQLNSSLIQSNSDLIQGNKELIEEIKDLFHYQNILIEEQHARNTYVLDGYAHIYKTLEEHTEILKFLKEKLG